MKLAAIDIGSNAIRFQVSTVLALERAQRLAERQARHAAAVARKAQLDDDAATKLDRIDRLDRAARAAEVEPVLVGRVPEPSWPHLAASIDLATQARARRRS